MYLVYFVIFSISCEITLASITAEYIVLEVSERSCLYVSNDPIWPYETTDGEAKAVSNCQRMGLPLASDIDQEEKDALQQLTRKLHKYRQLFICNYIIYLGCQMEIPEGRGILVKQENNNCKFQKYDGSEEDSGVRFFKMYFDFIFTSLFRDKIVLKTLKVQVMTMHLSIMRATKIQNVVSEFGLNQKLVTFKYSLQRKSRIVRLFHPTHQAVTSKSTMMKSLTKIFAMIWVDTYQD